MKNINKINNIKLQKKNKIKFKKYANIKITQIKK